MVPMNYMSDFEAVTSGASDIFSLDLFIMCDHGSERSEIVEVEDEMAGQQPLNKLRGILGGPWVPALGGGPKRNKRLALVNQKTKTVYDLSA